MWQDGVDPKRMSRVAIEDAYGESPPPPLALFGNVYVSESGVELGQAIEPLYHEAPLI